MGKFAYSFGVSRVDVRSFYSAKYKNGNHERDPFGNTNTSLRLDYEINDNFDIGVAHRYAYAKYDYDASWPAVADDFDNTGRFHQNIGSFYLNNKVNDFLSHKFTYGVVDIQRRGWEGDTDYWYRGKSNQFKYALDYKPAALYNAIIGYEYVGDKGESYWKPTNEPKHRANSKSVFVQNILRPLDSFFISFVIRGENHSTFGNNITYGLSSSYLITLTNTKLKASIGTGFRAPSLYELFDSYSGNRGLNPEKSKSFDIGFEQNIFDDRFSFGFTYFENKIKNKIDWQSTGLRTGEYANIGGAEIYGIESFAGYKFNDKIFLKLTYDYLHAQNESDKSRLFRRPNNKLGLLFNATLGKLKIAPEIYYVGNRIDTSIELRKSNGNEPLIVLSWFHETSWNPERA
ncbi:MAG: TonB-dependent receptor, partial [Candidatus Omnitrophica bacterium]|nr:TonB-dependent receptor [Candidatus Omnitrophota bacterium]